MRGVILIPILAFIIIFGVVVFIHELGHFVVAKLSHVRVEEFGLGFPPRLVRLFKRGDTEYTINAIPIGGFVRLAGENDASVPDSMANKSPWIRGGVLAAGAFMNVVLAAALFGLSFVMGVLTPVQGPGVGIYDVSPNSPAEAAGLRLGDTILAIDGNPVNNPSDLTAYVKAHVGQPVLLTMSRDQKTLPEPVRVVPRAVQSDKEGSLGVSIGDPLARARFPIWQAAWLGLQRAYLTVVATVAGLVAMIRGLFHGQGAPDLTGPIGIAQITAQVAKSGFVQLIEWMAFLSVNLGVVNLLPIPGLDGGRIIFVVLELLRGGKKMDPAKEGIVHLVGILALLVLAVVISYFDVVRILQGGRIPGM
jgi:regulator of sigma E protease